MSAKRLFFCPSTGGFKSLRAMAYHPGTEALYVPLNLSCEMGQSRWRQHLRRTSATK